ncbi:MAG: 50S ribosomal protein L10 [Patescibacteria group bacterium]
MKTKAQKQSELKDAEALLKNSKSLLFADFGSVSAESLRMLRREVSANGGSFLVLKKRLLNVLLKSKGIEYDVREFFGPVGTVFVSTDTQSSSAALFRFFRDLAGTDVKAREVNVKKILGGYDLEGKAVMARDEVMMLGTLPPREVLLGQLLGTLAGPIRSFLYVLSEQSKKVAN